MSRIAIHPADLEAFLKVAELGSFSVAAETLGMSQPSVTTRVSRLESRLGQQLLRRTTRRVQVTDAGEQFRVRAAVIIQQMQGLYDDFHLEPHQRQRTVVFGAITNLAAVMLPNLIADYTRSQPRTRIHMRDGTVPGLCEELQRGHLEFALLGFDATDPDIEYSVLLDEECVLIARRGHHLVSKPEVDLAEVVNYPFLMLHQKVSMWRTLIEAFERRGLTMHPAFEADSIFTLVGLVEAGMGVTLVPLSVCEKLDRHAFGFSRIAGLSITRPIGIAKLRHRGLSVEAEQFVRFLKGRLSVKGGAGRKRAA